MNYAYGIEGVKFIWNGINSDPEIEYENHIYNFYDFQDALWYWFCEENYPYCKPHKVELMDGIETEFQEWISNSEFDILDMLDDWNFNS